MAIFPLYLNNACFPFPGLVVSKFSNISAVGVTSEISPLVPVTFIFAPVKLILSPTL